MTIEETLSIIKKFRLCDIAELDSAMPMALAALEKQKPMKIRYLSSTLCCCPVCDDFVNSNQKYCPYCGQALDWSEVKEDDT